MSRKTVRVKIPRRNPDDMLTLIENINRQNKKLGKGSPMDQEDGVGLTEIQKEAKPERQKAKDFEKRARSHNAKARKLLGLDEKQNTRTKGTGLYYVAQVRDTLLKKFRGNEEKLAEWGFEVVVGQARNPRPRDH